MSRATEGGDGDRGRVESRAERRAEERLGAGRRAEGRRREGESVGSWMGSAYVRDLSDGASPTHTPTLGPSARRQKEFGVRSAD